MIEAPTSLAVETFPDVMDVPTVCRFLGIHRNTLSELMHRADDPIPFRRIGRKYGVRFLKRAVEGWLTQGADESQPRRMEVVK